MLRKQDRKEAYEYIREHIVRLHGFSIDSEHSPVVPLNELMLLKEGLIDPSAELVTSLKLLLRGSVTEADIDAHLVMPFQQLRID